MRRLIPLALSALLAACAPAPRSGLAVFSPADVDVRPQLLGCSGYTTPLNAFQEVFLEYVVDASGEVQSSSILPRATPPAGIEASAAGPPAHPPSARALTVARRLAAGCVYEPGRIGEHAVAVRVVERFAF